MDIQFRIIDPSDMLIILPLLYTLNEGAISEVLLKDRILEMAYQNYECLGIYKEDELIGICGMWFQTRHYAGKSCEIDHVIVDDSHRNLGIGGMLMDYVYDYCHRKECQWVELNTYVDNYPSHKFYRNQGFVAKGYHFVKDITQAVS